MTLESQYKEYLKDNPDSTYSFDEWKEKVYYPILESFIRREEKCMTTATQVVALINIGILFYIMWLLVK
jgi:hypothetical protein